ncbi:ABC transporter ATP-binding protein [Brevibacterium album]|uniref:ABC transporter ATP-binding protein n=1 Tax=Brevibacterium album TaxID=417948 RepID=UPI0004216CBA|nr:sn-glycerol-3-phosphate ABC transporter ATP-binding protein UgpC [Brevibacterium album]
MAAISITNLTRAFKGSLAVRGIDLEIADGDFCVLLGPSGCGKTTLLRMIAGLLEPTSGTIELDGKDITDLASKKRDIAMVFQSYALYPHLTVHRNLEFPLSQARRADGSRPSREESRARIREVAASLEIDHLLERRPKELSGGQRQRVAVGRALVREPKAFLMDEPLSNLDAALRTQTRQELTGLHRRLGSTFVYVTHDQVEAMTMATRIVVLNNGAIEQAGTPLEVYDTPASTFVATFIGSPAMNLLPAQITTADGAVRAHGGSFSADLWPGSTPDADVLLGARPEHLRILEPGEAAPAVSFPLQVSNAEQLGHETIVYGHTPGAEVCVRRSRCAGVEPGDTVQLGLDLRHLHVFDRETGRRMEWIPDSPDPETVADPAPSAALPARGEGAALPARAGAEAPVA